jgi:hypothetical protein
LAGFFLWDTNRTLAVVEWDIADFFEGRYGAAASGELRHGSASGTLG